MSGSQPAPNLKPSSGHIPGEMSNQAPKSKRMNMSTELPLYTRPRAKKLSTGIFSLTPHNSLAVCYDLRAGKEFAQGHTTAPKPSRREERKSFLFNLSAPTLAVNFQRDTGPDHILLPSTETFPPGSHFGFYCSHHLELPGLYPGLKYRILVPTASESPLGQLGSVPRQVLTTGLTTITYNNRKAQVCGKHIV